MEHEEKGPSKGLSANWVPGESIGLMKFGGNVDAVLNCMSLSPCDLDGDYKDGIKHQAFCDEEDHWIVSTEDSSISAVACNHECYYKGVNVLGLQIDECLLLLGCNGTNTPDDTIWIEDGNQDVYEVDTLGAQIWVRNKHVVCMFLSEIYAEDGETIIHPFRL